MKIAFLSEMGFEGKVPRTHTNMRTEFAWMVALDADHYNIHDYGRVKDYDHIFVIFPKGEVKLNAIGLELSKTPNPISDLLRMNFISVLKSNNKGVYFVQEGPHWLWNDYSITDQIYYYNMISGCDKIFAHNISDVYYYKGMYEKIPVYVIPSLMIDDLIKNISPTKEDKVIIGGNFARWYGGFESYIVASELDMPIYAQSSHAMRSEEALIQNLTHFPRMAWEDWMKELSKFSYAVHLMPTVAAGTFAMNCASFGIPCIGNIKVDTQMKYFPELSVEVNDIAKAKQLMRILKNDKDFYNHCATTAIEQSKDNEYTWKVYMHKILNNE